ncbi:hypothetical protein OAU13_00325 [bacterium]|nr:hypothetical protein [bacterium]
MTQFCHIAPIDFLDLVKDYNSHLTLAHLIETSEEYTSFYKKIKAHNKDAVIIMDNSAFEMYKQGKPMLTPMKVLEMANTIRADYVVLSDYPGEHSSKTIQAAIDLAPLFRSQGFGTFFVPQSKIGDKEDLINAFDWASTSKHVDYIGVSILGVPNAYSVEKNNKLQRFVARYMFMQELHDRGILQRIRKNKKKIHFLGMVDGPNEIKLMDPYREYIDTWDSSAAVWLGLNGGTFDGSPTGIFDGKFEKEVDFDLKQDSTPIDFYRMAKYNMDYIDTIVTKYLNDDPGY